MIKFFARHIAVFLLFSAFATLSIGDGGLNDGCNGELISELNNISSTTSRTESGTLYDGFGIDDDDDYYYFKPGVAGILSIDNYSSSRNTDLYISNANCSNDNGNNDRVLKDGTDYSGTLSLSSVQTVYIRVKRKVKNATTSYSIPLTFTKASSSEINVVGVANGAIDASFGSALVTGGTIDKTYTVENLGSSTLTLQNVTISGTHSSDFSVVSQPSLSVAAGGSTTLSVRFDPSALGTRDAVISFANNDADENPYNFSISGVGDSPPIMLDVPNQTATVGAQFSLNIASYVTLTNSDPIINYTLTGTLPSGLSFNTSTGVLSGTPSAATSSITLSVSATDNDGASNSDTFTISVNALSPITENLRDFSIRNPIETRNINGNLKVIGNTVLCVKSGGNCYNYTGTKSNAELDLRYIDVDGDASTFNSSKAQINIPQKAVIKWAGVYTQGYLKGQTLQNSKTILQEPIYLSANGVDKFASTPSQIDLYPNDNYGYTYGTFSEVSQFIGKKGSEINGYVTAANIKSYQGEDGSGLGNYGAWTLVIVYEDENESLKNISVFDGYKRVANQTGFKNVNINVSGFLTPSSGDVKSTLSVFAGEGDKNIQGDKLYVDGYAINETNAFYSYISGNFTRSPSYTNNQGIDIQNHDVSRIIQHNQHNATITLTSTQDTYFPSMVAFTTELYIPDVCYKENITFNGLPIAIGNIPSTGDNVVFDVNITNVAAEPAKGVFVERIFNNPNEITYVANSMQIAPISSTTYSSKTDAIGDDTAEYSTETNTTKFLLGSGATAHMGGIIAKDDITRIKFTARAGIMENVNQSIYLVSYRNDLFGVSFTGIPIRKCSLGTPEDVNESFPVYVPVIGSYNTVRSGAVNVAGGDKDPIDPLDAKNALYTRVANQTFLVDVISFGADNITPTAPPQVVDLNLSIVELSPDGSCTNNNISAVQRITFNTSDKYKTVSITPQVASNYAAFHMVTNSTNICSRDNFVIRPAEYNITFSPSGTLRAGNEFNTTIIAKGSSSSLLSGYDGKAAINVSTQNTSCPVRDGALSDSMGGSIGLTQFDGVDTAVLENIKFGDIGLYDVNVTDSTWTGIDSAKGDCIALSSSYTPDGSGKVGCLINSSESVAVIPDHFEVASSLTDSGSGFTYLSSDLNTSATLNITVTAQSLSDAVTKNYNSGCYAKTTSFDISYDNISVTPSQSLSKLKFFETNSSTNGEVDINFPLVLQNIPKGIFSTDTNGSAAITLQINFDRNAAKAVNPFTLNISDINVTDADAVEGSGTLDDNATFLFARAHAARQRYDGSEGTAKIYFETYCFAQGCDKSLLPNGTASKSLDDIRWYINENHDTSKDGNVTVVVQKGGANTASDKVDAGDNPQENPSSVDLEYDGSKGFPYKTTLQYGASGWLIQNDQNASATTNEFQVEFYEQGDWSGEHETNTTTKTPDKALTNRRIMW